MVDLQATVGRHELPLAAPFGISRGTTESTTVVAIEVEDADSDADRVGIGAASPTEYYGEDGDSVEAALPDLLALLNSVEAPLQVARGGSEPDAEGPPDLARVEDVLREAAPEDAAARAGLSIALHDLAAKRRELPLYQLWGLDPAGAPPTSFTVGIDEPETMAERARAAVERGHEHLKVKLGTDADAERLAAVREAAPDAALRVDANGAWSRDEALERLVDLEEQDVELVEQPVPAADVEGLRAVSERAPMPVAADEACVDAEDVAWVAEACDVVVCKAMKCGGLAAARRQIAAARWHDCEVMLGCNVESSASIAAAWHLAPLVSYADLDGDLLLDADPYEGLDLLDGAADLAGLERAGTGARRGDDGE